MYFIKKICIAKYYKQQLTFSEHFRGYDNSRD